MSRDLPHGIRRTPQGYQAYVWVADPTHPKGGFQASKRYPATAFVSTMKAWRNRRRLNLDEDQPAHAFADDARAYLARDKVAKMPTREQREQHIEEWIAIFGARDRAAIQPHEIQEALDGMRTRLSAGSVNKRRTALMDLWTTLDGRHQANPVKATTVYDEPVPEPRAPALAKVLTILRAMPTRTEYARKCRARASVIAWTGWPHAILKQVQPDDLDLKARRAFVNRRRKGKGAAARWLPLLPEAVRALRAFHRVGAYGPFSNSSFHKRVTAASTPHGKIRPYDLRHFFGTLIATITRDERAVQELMLLSTVEQARRYTAAATDPRVQAAVAEVGRKLPGLRRAAERLRGRNSATALPRTRDRAKSGRKTR